MLRMRVRGLKQVVQTVKDVKGQLRFDNISDFGEQFKEVIKEGMRANNRKSSYHGYPSIYTDGASHLFALENSVKISYPGKGRVVASVYAPYAEAVEFGRKGIHGKLMVFRGKGGEKVFTHKVASTKPGKRYMLKAAMWAERNTKKYFETRINRVINSKGKNSGYGVLLARK
jgi:hypothetical protein